MSKNTVAVVRLEINPICREIYTRLIALRGSIVSRVVEKIILDEMSVTSRDENETMKKAGSSNDSSSPLN